MAVGKVVAGVGAGIGAGIAVAIAGLFVIFIFAIIGALMGAVGGFIVQLTPWLGDTVASGFAQIFGVESPDLVAIGAMLGFIAGFFRQWGQDKCS